MKAGKKNVDTKKYRFDTHCFSCRVTSYSDEFIKYCSYCGSQKLTVNDHKTLTSTWSSDE